MKKYVLITGGSSGIGKSLANTFAMHGYNLLLVARRETLLKEVRDTFIQKYHADVIIYPLDLTKDNAIIQLHDYCLQNDLDIEILINNAGMGAQGRFTDVSLDKQEKIIALNVSAVVKMCHVFSKDMMKKECGTVVNICSTTAFMPLANEAVYAASKAFILSFSQALYEEMKPFGVSVCTICPGVTNTDFFKSADFELDHFKGADPDAFAHFAYQKIMHGKPLSIHRAGNVAISMWARLFPRSFVRKISSRFG